MSKFISPGGVTFSVDDSKDERYDVEGFQPVGVPAAKKAPAKKAASSKSDK